MATDPRLEDFPTTIHLLTVDRFILMPETTLPAVITDKRYAGLVESLAEDGYLGFILPRTGDEERQFQEVGCLGRVREMERGEEGLNVIFEGLLRFRVRRELPEADRGGVFRAEVDYQEFAADLEPEPEEIEGWNLERIKAALLQIGHQQKAIGLKSLEAMSPRQIIRAMAQTLPFAAAEKQALLEARDFRALLELLFALLAINFLTTTPDDSRAPVN